MEAITTDKYVLCYAISLVLCTISVYFANVKPSKVKWKVFVGSLIIGLVPILNTILAIIYVLFVFAKTFANTLDYLFQED